MTIGENIKRIRLQRGLTQAELGNLIGISDSMVRRYELGIRTPKIDKLQKIAYSLGVNVEALLNTEIDEDTAMHHLFQLFRQYGGSFAPSGDLQFQNLDINLAISAWRQRWNTYQDELRQAERIEDEREQACAIENAEKKFNWWMDTYPETDAAWIGERNKKKTTESRGIMKIAKYLRIERNLKLFRINADMTQKEMAARLGISVPTYSNYENGYSEPPMKVIQNFCEVLGISEDDFFRNVVAHGGSDNLVRGKNRTQIVDKIAEELLKARLLNETDYSSTEELREACREIMLAGLSGYSILKGDVY